LPMSMARLIYTSETLSEPAAGKAKSHMPQVTAPNTVKAGEPFKVTITIGPHPNQAQHSIRWIEVYYSEEGRDFNPVFLARVELAPEYAEPQVELTFRLKRTGTLHVLGYCNLHGVWEATKHIKVEEGG